MAVLTAKKVALNMQTVVNEAKLFASPVQVAATPTSYTATYSVSGVTHVVKLTGSFTYSPPGSPFLASGTVTGAEYSRAGVLNLSVTSASVPVADVLTYLNAKDIDGLIARIFAGNDTINGSSSTSTIPGNDYLMGFAGNDTIDGKSGADTMDGGLGNDTYIIDNPGDKIIDSSLATNSLADKARSSVSYTLNTGARVETLETTNAAGLGAINLSGNESGQTILGNAGINVLKGNGGVDTIKGGAGNDKIYGGLGNDVLWGQAGKDGFYFDTTPNASANRDRIEDFISVDDSILLKKSIFSPTGQIGTLATPTTTTPAAVKTSEFKSINGFNPAAPAGLDPAVSIIYDKLSGKIYYDKDGSGAAAAVHFATVDPGTVLAASDFLIFI